MKLLVLGRASLTAWPVASSF